MRTCDYADVLNGALALRGISPADVLTNESVQFRGYSNKHLQRASEKFYWPDLLRLEQRWFRGPYDAAVTYTNDGTVIYFPQTQLYYLALKSTIGNPPANSSGVLDSSRWALAAMSWAADNFSATPTYTVGDIRFYPTTQLYYALHTAAVAGTLPTDSTKWGVLTPFDRYVAYAQTNYTAIGEVVQVWDINPRIFNDAQELSYELSNNGIQIMDDVPYVYVKYRVRLSNLTGDAYSATVTYTASTSQIYYSSATLRGNFYNCVTSTSAGDSPDSAAAKWSKVEIPYIFQRYLTQALYAEWLLNQGQEEKFGKSMGMADDLLAEQVMLLAGQQQQGQRTTVLTR